MNSEPTSQHTETRLKNLPIPLYGSVMGLAGLALAVERLEELRFDSNVGSIILYAVSIWLLLLSGAYLTKWIRYPAAVGTEYRHPVRMNFFPAISISLLLLAIGYLNRHHTVSAVLWYAGTGLHLFFLLRTLRVWFFRGLELQSFNPAWFIPVVGTILIPIAGVEHAPIEISWFFFSIGIVFWIAMLGMTLHRVIFHNGLPPKLLPTLFILIAPPAVGFIAYLKLNCGLDTLARILYFNGLFMVLMVLVFADRFVRLPFFLSWWAYTFPLAAATLSTFAYYDVSNVPFFFGLAVFLLLLLIATITVVAVRTGQAAMNRQLCVPES